MVLLCRFLLKVSKLRINTDKIRWTSFTIAALHAKYISCSSIWCFNRSLFCKLVKINRIYLCPSFSLVEYITVSTNSIINLIYTFYSTLIKRIITNFLFVSCYPIDHYTLIYSLALYVYATQHWKMTFLYIFNIYAYEWINSSTNFFCLLTLISKWDELVQMEKGSMLLYVSKPCCCPLLELLLSTH